MRALIPIALAALLQAPSAGAQVIGDPEAIRLLILDAGLSASLGTDPEGDPIIKSRIDDTTFSVYFYQCERICASMQFSAGFDLDQPMPVDRVNQWNRDRRFGRVYLDETGDPFVEMDIGLAGDGIGRQNFNEALETWRLVLSEFRDFMDW